MDPDPGQAFQHLYAALAGRHPASPVAYTAHVRRPYSCHPLPEPARKRLRELLATQPFIIVDTTEIPEEQYPSRTASEWLIEFATTGVRDGYQPLWVDLEASYTLADVVGSIVDQCRALDTQLPPSVMPLGDLPEEQLAWTAEEWAQDPVVASAARRTAHALDRSRYLVLLDGLEAYLWPPLVHHGEVESHKDKDGALLAQLGGFLTALRHELKKSSGSRIVLGVDRSNARSGESVGAQLTNKYAKFVRQCAGEGWERVLLDSPHSRFTDTFTGPSVNDPLVQITPQLNGIRLSDHSLPLVWLTLSCVRRGRQLATARRLLRPFARGQKADELVATLCDETNGPRLGFTRLEGGGLWYHRPVRDHVYAANSRGCGTKIMSELLALPDQPERDAENADAKLAAAQAALLAATHLRVSGVYYSNVYLQSRDAVAFLEYTYHRRVHAS